MTESRRSIVSSIISAGAGCLLLAACSSSGTAGRTPAAAPTTRVVVAATPPPSTASVTVAPASQPAASQAASSSRAVPTLGAGKTACVLISEQAVTTVLGSDPGHGSAFSSRGSSQCQYGSYQKALVLVNITPGAGRAAYENFHQSPQLHGKADVPGVGDSAFEVGGPHTAGIYFFKNDAIVVVMVMMTTSAAPKAQVLALAKLAADGM